MSQIAVFSIGLSFFRLWYILVMIFFEYQLFAVKYLSRILYCSALSWHTKGTRTFENVHQHYLKFISACNIKVSCTVNYSDIGQFGTNRNAIFQTSFEFKEQF